jgi:hypothetical protein
LAEAESLLSDKSATKALLLGISSGTLLALLLDQTGESHDFPGVLQIGDTPGIYRSLEKEWKG